MVQTESTARELASNLSKGGAQEIREQNRLQQLLPIGSVVSLKGVGKRLMIYGIEQLNETNGRVYDYIACPYPEGNTGEEYNYFFDHDAIKKIDFLGFSDSESQAFRKKLAGIGNTNERVSK